MKPSAQADPEELLETLLRQDEGRLVEGFPVVLYNALRENDSLGWEKKDWRPAKTLRAGALKRLTGFLVLSFLLYRLFGLEKGLLERVRDLLRKCPEGEKTLKDFEAPFLKSEAVKAGALELSTSRLKTSFRRYVVEAPESKGNEKKVHDLELELLLSELFAPRQKELLRKRLAKKPMTATEKAYYYRTVSKRLKALANEELHQLARHLV
ncbi:MAG: hypothetical protein HYU34_03300 [Candidatus Omnitrophica bacterium]|nr:hypothetical protein [Candidatus Omnitrophota bacterium]